MRLYSAIPRFQVHLDAPPLTRWRQVGERYSSELHAMLGSLENGLLFPALAALPFGFTLYEIAVFVLTVVAMLDFAGVVVPYSWELWGLARASNMSLGKLVAMQYIYEASTACTSVVVPDGEGRPQLLRTLDWAINFDDFTLDLRPVLFDIEFMRQGKVVLHGVTFAGLMGLLTAMVPGPEGYAVSINYRTSSGAVDVDGEVTFSAVSFAMLRRIVALKWSVAAALRNTCQLCSTFGTAVRRLKRLQLVSPVYYIVCGCQPGEGVIVSRTPHESLKPLVLGTRPGIVQTNTDHWLCDPMQEMLEETNRKRSRRRALSMFRRVTSAAVGLEKHWDMLATFPIANELTIHAVVSVPARGVWDARASRFMLVGGDDEPVEYAWGD